MGGAVERESGSPRPVTALSGHGEVKVHTVFSSTLRVTVSCVFALQPYGLRAALPLEQNKYTRS